MIERSFRFSDAKVQVRGQIDSPARRVVPHLFHVFASAEGVAGPLTRLVLRTRRPV